MYEDDYEDEGEYARYGICSLYDALSSDEIEEIRQKNIDEENNAPLSMDSLGLSWRDFF